MGSTFLSCTSSTMGWTQHEAAQHDFFQERLEAARRVCSSGQAAVETVSPVVVATARRRALCTAINTDHLGNESCVRWGITPDAR
jgi:hypothetical protein